MTPVNPGIQDCCVDLLVQRDVLLLPATYVVLPGNCAR